MDTYKKTTSIKLKKSLYDQVKERARIEHRSIDDLLEFIISDAMENMPNEETKKALEQAIKDKPYSKHKWYDNKNELLNDLFK